MKRPVILLSFLLFAFVYSANSQKPDQATLARGFNFIETKTYQPEDDARILELFKDLRVADVSDGLDMAGLPGT